MAEDAGGKGSAREQVLRLSPKITILPVIHGSGDFAQEVRERILRLEPDCLAVPLPPSFQELVEAGVDQLPRLSFVAAEEPSLDAGSGYAEEEEEYSDPSAEPWEDISGDLPEGDLPEEETGDAPDDVLDGDTAADLPSCNYVPIEPCQPVIAALRVAMGERIARAFIDREVPHFYPEETALPDPYALKEVSLEAFAAALLTRATMPLPGGQRDLRIRTMAHRLRALEADFENIVFVCAALDWPWVRKAYREEPPPEAEETFYAPLRRYDVAAETAAFLIQEIPYIAYLYEKRREELRGDRHLSIDGVKELLLEARAAWLSENAPAYNWLTPQRLQVFLQYVRNLTLQAGRLTPDLFTLVLAAKQVGGDEFAVSLADTARRYPLQEEGAGGEGVRLGIEMAEFPDGGVARMKNRLGGQQLIWRSISLKPKPKPLQKKEWAQRWNPYGICSWPPEDTRIESFHTHVREQARALLGQDLARSEKFTTSIKDGLDMRETLRNFHTGDLYVKEIPPARGAIEVVVFLFDTPADPEKYAWRTMWYAEHEEESTLCMYATPFEENLVGPGVAESTYGGAFFVFPPRLIADVWTDPRFAFAQTLEERLIAGACFHSQERFVALVSPSPPLPRWRQIARMTKKHLIHIPLGRFSRDTLERSRRFHVLNGREVRSYAARFIREM
ncbi:MAG: hypothetical protein O2807_01255 [bacterium]|nr:hypothetical protein [bacterium]